MHLLSFALMVFSVFLVYIQASLLKRDMTREDTFLPMIMWSFNLLFMLLFFISAYLNLKRRHILLEFFVGVLFVIGVYNGITGMNEYLVLWNDGTVIVKYTNPNAEFIHSVVQILLLFLTIYVLYTRILAGDTDVTNRTDTDADMETHVRLVWLLVSGIILLGTYFLPRTTPGSITDPLSIKLFAYAFFYAFLGVYIIAWIAPQKGFEAVLRFLEKMYTKERQQNFLQLLQHARAAHNGLLLLAVISAIGLVSTIVWVKVGRSFVTIYTESSLAVRDGVAVYLFTWRGIKWYIHVYGGLIPIVAMFGILIFLVMSTTKDNNANRRMFGSLGIVIVVQVLLAYVFNNVLKWGRYYNEHYTPFILAFVLPTMFYSLWELFMNPHGLFPFSSKENVLKLGSWYRIVPLNVYVLSGLYSATVISTVLADFLSPSSPTGKLLIGGASFVDGIFLVPLFNVFLTAFLTSTLVLTFLQVHNKKHKGCLFYLAYKKAVKC